MEKLEVSILSATKIIEKISSIEDKAIIDLFNYSHNIENLYYRGGIDLTEYLLKERNLENLAPYILFFNFQTLHNTLVIDYILKNHWWQNFWDNQSLCKIFNTSIEEVEQVYYTIQNYRKVLKFPPVLRLVK